MSSDTSIERFSTVADFDLVVNGRSYKVAQVAPDFLLLDTATEIPPGHGVLVIRVEGARKFAEPLSCRLAPLRDTDRVLIRRLDL